MLEVLVVLGVFVLALESFDRAYYKICSIRWFFFGEKLWRKECEKEEKKARKRNK